MIKGADELVKLLSRIVYWSDKIFEILQNKSFDEFAKDEVLQLAVSKCSESVGEAARLLLNNHSETVQKIPGLKLLEAYGFRNRLAHGYETVNIEIVWDTVQADMPELGNSARKLLNEYENKDER